MLKRIKYIIIILFIQFIAIKTEAQYNFDVEKRISLSFQIFGPELLGIYMNYNFNDRLSTNAGFGLNLDAHIGLNYYVTDRSSSHSSLFTGAQIITYREYQLDLFGSSSSSDPEREFGLYFPIGYEYIAKSGFIFHADVGLNITKADWGQINDNLVLGSVKFGYLFNK